MTRFSCHTGHVSALAPRAGDLLVCAHAGDADYFAQTVIYLLDNDKNGSIGLVLNRPAEKLVSWVLPDWADELNPPAVLFSGGPVSHNGAVCLARVMTNSEEPPGWRRIYGHIGLLNLDTPVEIVRGAYSDMRVFVGYAGWEPGQLVDEIRRGVWFCTGARDEDLFTSQTAGMWRRVLRRAGGDAGLMSGFTSMPESN